MISDGQLIDVSNIDQLLAPEVRERAAAWRMGETRAAEREIHPESARAPHVGLARAGVAARAFATLAENVRDYAIFLVSPEGFITFWGEGARLIKWWTRDQTEGMHMRLLYPAGGSVDGTAEDHLRIAAERGEYTGEGERVRSDDSTFWAGVTITALRDENAKLLGFAKVTRDLTARRAATALLLSAADAAEAANRAKSEFLAMMSHEIRTPVNAIIGYHDLLELETDGPLTPGQRQHLARASASGRHLVSLITEVLDFSRLEAGHATVKRTVFCLGDVVAEALSLVEPVVNTRGLELTNALSGYVAGIAVYGDEARVRQILANLLANAVKFTEARDGIPGRVIVSAGTAAQASPDAQLSGPGPWVYIRVEDTGHGVPAERLEAIFEPFIQADTSLTREHGGTGLGLAISRRFARLMGGDVTAKSMIDVGSTFSLWLPAAPVESLQTGGVEGSGPLGEATVLSGPWRELADVVLAELDSVLHACAARLYSDPALPKIYTSSDTQVEDHLASFLAHLAGTLASLDMLSGQTTDAVRDAMEIQRVIAERHGAQHARLGWTEEELQREFMIIGEELATAVRRRASALFRGPTPEARHGEAERALELLSQLLAVAKHLSLEGFRRFALHQETHGAHGSV